MRLTRLSGQPWFRWTCVLGLAAGITAAATPGHDRDAATLAAGPSTSDPTLHRAGAHSYIEEPAPTLTQTARTATAPRTAYALSRTFTLHSNPGARRTIFLDFNGALVSGTAWNRTSGLPNARYPGLNKDGEPGFSDGEKAIVQGVWRRVAEDYAPFAVDVTTEDPGRAALWRSSSTDGRYGVRVLVTRSGKAMRKICGGTCAGLAYIGVFNGIEARPEFHQIVWVFSETLFNKPAWIAAASAHEAGHTLGLHHDGVSGQSSYYMGKGIWSPIMGGISVDGISQFSMGEYSGANNHEDDLARMVRYGAPRRLDDYGGDPRSATSVTNGVVRRGVIESREDTDVFAVRQGCDGPLTVAARPVAAGPNLDIKLTISNGVVVDPASGPGPTGLAAVYSATVPKGSYYLSVDGVGRGDPLASGYSDYGSLGRYSLRVTASCPTS